MMQAVEASLKLLKTDYINLYWVHIWDQITPVEEELSGERWPESIHPADIAGDLNTDNKSTQAHHSNQ